MQGHEEGSIDASTGSLRVERVERSTDAGCDHVRVGDVVRYRDAGAWLTGQVRRARGGACAIPIAPNCRGLYVWAEAEPVPADGRRGSAPGADPRVFGDGGPAALVSLEPVAAAARELRRGS
eukprot:gene27215-11649_t